MHFNLTRLGLGLLVIYLGLHLAPLTGEDYTATVIAVCAMGIIVALSVSAEPSQNGSGQEDSDVYWFD